MRIARAVKGMIVGKRRCVVAVKSPKRQLTPAEGGG